MELIIFAGTVVGLLLLWIIYIFINHVASDFRQFSLEASRTKYQESLNVTHRSFNLLGTYGELPIWQYLTLENGRTYEFESVALLLSSGDYHRDRPAEHHVIIGGKLLYKEVSCF